MMHRLRLLLLVLFLSGCSGWQTPLDPHSAAASHLAGLFWFFTVVCAAVWLAVVLALLYTLRRRDTSTLPDEDTLRQKQRKTLVVSALVGGTVLILAIFTLTSFYTTRSFAWADQNALRIKITGQQWWWQVEYQAHDPSQEIYTANEIHIPVGRPVTFELDAGDVIHSFWVPDLMGKQDLIPGRRNYLTPTADKAGTYRGQCAEFCGLQHAHMAFLVIADPPDVFERWRKAQIQSAAAPKNGMQARGLRLFLDGPCAACHTVNGTGSGGQTAPDLTHFASRSSIAAGTLANTAENLDRWLADPQTVKPGNNMPQVPLSKVDRAALVAYLLELK